MFKIVNSKRYIGFQLIFENGWTALVQFGPRDYIANAEIAAWDSNNKRYIFEDECDVKGWVKSKEVADFIAMIAAKENDL